VTRVLLESGRAIGVEFRQGGETKTRARIVRGHSRWRCDQFAADADAFGIGDPDELAKHGIKASVPVKGVGKNLQDHVVVQVAYGRKSPVHPPRHAARPHRGGTGEDLFFGTGIATDLPGGVASLRASCRMQRCPISSCCSRQRRFQPGHILSRSERRLRMVLAGAS
jgi:choline dehydrogenase-like flavoprotein